MTTKFLDIKNALSKFYFFVAFPTIKSANFIFIVISPSLSNRAIFAVTLKNAGSSQRPRPQPPHLRDFAATATTDTKVLMRP